ncbi:hypothetical protein H2509_00580, partial [Stappia sp. F7233]|nr:hypothetical protein [Stappia albiluteola]
AAIAGLGSQQEALGSNPAATGVIRGLEQEIDALSKTAEQRRLDQELKKAGVALASQEGQSIANNVRQLFERKAAIEAEEEARRKAELAANRAAARGIREQDTARQRVQDLSTALDDELAILRTSDPVMREMIRLRHILAAATDEERAILEKKIELNVLEAEAYSDFQENAAIVRGAVSDIVSGLRNGENAFEVLADTALRAL